MRGFRGVLLLVVLVLPGVASARQARLEYSVHADRFHVLDASFRLDLGGARYLLEGEAYTTGLLAFFFAYRVSFWSAGMLEDDQVQPGSFGNKGSTSQSQRRVEMVYDDTGPRVVSLFPGPDEDQREPVPEDLRAGTIDPLSAAVLAARRVDETARCPSTPVRIFDGRRLFTLSFEPVEAPLPADLELPGQVMPPLVACRLSAEQQAGHWRGERGRWRFGPFQRREESAEVPTLVWFGRLHRWMPVLPLVLERDGGWRIRVQLSDLDVPG